MNIKLILSVMIASSTVFPLSAQAKMPFTGYKAWAFYTYSEADLNGIIDKDLFLRAFDEFGYSDREKDILTIIDYTKPSSQRRFYVIDVKNPKLLFHTYVSHGISSGELYATKFSNKADSLQTSLGAFKTAETYIGRNGYSLRLDGLDFDLNDNARDRFIVVHGAAYAKPYTIDQIGMLGRSEGCPALPSDKSKEIIDTIKGGSIIYSWGIDLVSDD